jgi:hypothetical protein
MRPLRCGAHAGRARSKAAAAIYLSYTFALFDNPGGHAYGYSGSPRPIYSSPQRLPGFSEWAILGSNQ